MADFQKAFPKVWRDDLIAIMAEGPQVEGGALALLSNVFEYDVIQVRHSGDSQIRVDTGIPEGGTMGTLCIHRCQTLLSKNSRQQGTE